MLEYNVIKKNISDVLKRINIIKEQFNYLSKSKRLKHIIDIFQNPCVWNNSKQIKSLGKERSYLESIITKIDEITQHLEDLSKLSELSFIEKDGDLCCDIEKELSILENKLYKLEIQSMFVHEYDHVNCYVDIQSGSGGVEAQDWAYMLLKMYLRWIEMKSFKSEIIEESVGEITGLKSVTIKVSGSYAYGWLRTETGIHRLVRKSPFDSSGRRHTSFCSVYVYPDIHTDISIKLDPSDLRFDVYRSSGAGGQHVNRTESAVRITHLPTNIVTQCQSDRSQHKNKEQALRQLRAKLYKFELQKKNMEKKILEDNKSTIGWGNQIRSYILDASRVKDLRTAIEICDIKAVLNGYIDKFVEASIKAGL
ncbi:peptide chain release factor 2 [Blochmannia endosymbiont of Camponotus (Colobopsis) obliquus]|uniref:peptide chain release factor 2 n=1 Tax=Blochmannia endosymbiont of Camponotus (Colobopsis) obliquus TaxID=1505597 RepID=UPI00061A72A0|nr:peptide chain release factor 2 [Blochmannia endosymbiont of Camponotus (Colobopsis) obliquus]AKC60426.1 peptide chain release factor 2 [Blochmannia endosymbiont of Camponotus (Colobopsis) obliquus]